MGKELSFLTGVSLAALVAVSVIFFMGEQNDDSVDQTNSFTADHGDAIHPEDPSYADSGTKTPDYPLETTKIANAGAAFNEPPLIHLAVDELGNLRISNDLRNVFDQFLLSIVDEDLDVITTRINAYLENQLQEPALSQAKDILAQYIDMKMALYELEQSLAGRMQGADLGHGNYLDLLKEQLDQRNRLRAEHLSQEVHEAFYSEEESYDAFTYERLLVINDKALSDEERAKQLDALESQLPKEVQEARQESQLTDVLQVRTDALIANGGDQQAVRALRQEMFGEEAAQRFDTLDQERAEWQSRLDVYMAQRTALLENKGLSEEARQEQIQQLKASQFDSREQIRVTVYESRASESHL